MTWFYLLVPIKFRKGGETVSRYNMYGPYAAYDRVLEANDQIGPGEIVELPTNDPEEAARMVNEGF